MEAVAQTADFLANSVERFAAAYQCDDKDTMLEIARGRHQSGLVLQRAMRQHRQIPIALGSGSSSLDQKVFCGEPVRQRASKVAFTRAKCV